MRKAPNIYSVSNITKLRRTLQGGKTSQDRWRSIYGLVLLVRLSITSVTNSSRFIMSQEALHVSQTLSVNPDPKHFYLLLALTQGSQPTELEAPDPTQVCFRARFPHCSGHLPWTRPSANPMTIPRLDLKTDWTPSKELTQKNNFQILQNTLNLSVNYNLFVPICQTHQTLKCWWYSLPSKNILIV